MTLDTGCHLIMQDVPPAPPTVKAPIVDVVVVVTLAPPPPPLVLVQEVVPVTGEESVLATLVGSTMVPSSTIVVPLLNASVATTCAPVLPPPSSSTSMVPPSTALAFTSTSSHLCVSLDHIYTSNDVDSLWGMGYKPKQKNLVGFVSVFDKNIISQPSFSILLILPRSSFNEVWKFLKKMVNDIKRC